MTSPGWQRGREPDERLERAVYRLLRHIRITPDEVLIRIGAVELRTRDGVRPLALGGLSQQFSARGQDAAERKLGKDSAVLLETQLCGAKNDNQ